MRRVRKAAVPTGNTKTAAMVMAELAGLAQEIEKDNWKYQDVDSILNIRQSK
eukprot:m.42528 g.42528  ORF g.42528 m.42528 type:complete len:52 (+) comp10702_c0_seq1:1-156(+)